MARFNSDSDRFRPVAVIGLRGGALFASIYVVNARAVAKREDLMHRVLDPKQVKLQMTTVITLLSLNLINRQGYLTWLSNRLI